MLVRAKVDILTFYIVWQKRLATFGLEFVGVNTDFVMAIRLISLADGEWPLLGVVGGIIGENYDLLVID